MGREEGWQLREREGERGGGRETSWFIWFSSQRRVTHSSESDSHRALVLSGCGGALTAGGSLWRLPQTNPQARTYIFSNSTPNVLQDMEISSIVRAFPVSTSQILSCHFSRRSNMFKICLRLNVGCWTQGLHDASLDIPYFKCNSGFYSLLLVVVWPDCFTYQ